MKKAYRLDESGINDEIRVRTENKARLEEQFEREKKRLETKMRNNVRSEILNDAQNALYNQSDALADSLLSGGGNFTMLVNNTLRSVLVSSTKQYVEQSFDEFLANLDTSFLDEGEYGMPEIDVDKMTQKLDRTKKIVNKIADNSQSFNGVYKVVATALAVTTTVVAPWLELVLIFLPDIIKGISSLISHSREKEAQENAKIQARNKVTNEIIPSIISKLEPEIDNSLNEMQNSMIDGVAESFNQRIDLEIQCLSDARNKLEANKAEYEEKTAEIDKSISVINSAIEAL